MGDFIEINGHHFKNKVQRQLHYRVIEDEEDLKILHFGNPKFPCGIVFIDDKNAIIISLSYYLKCTNPLLEKGVGMYGIMRAIIQKVLELRKQESLSFTNFELTDNSSILVDKYQVYLADAYRLITGNTWYQDILPELNLVPVNTVEYHKWYNDKLTLQHTTTAMIHYESVFPPNPDIEHLWKSFISRNIKDTCREIRNKNPIFWAQNYEKLMNHLNLSRLNGVVFVSTILPEKIDSCFRT